MLNSQASQPIFYSDAGHTSWVDVSAVSPAKIPSFVEWAIWDDIEIFF